ncbi:MAG TPA: bifunctional 3,4-dihydroxy-2-butanone-4-phosphate synthase/GTP cyclohydrolase II, partial [Phycisphaerales bacterium]|nr:bifunctional 3,4-dihydroxy-2-butanone-4-phosphate synthase/GTP cyclohydrolase II [Phycisphaerales bacterium]
GGGGEFRVRVGPPAGLMRFMSPKGSVCIDGVSLTIAALDPGDTRGEGGWIEVALIPETLEKTTLGRVETGDLVNIEADILAKTVVHFLQNYAGPGGASPAVGG